MGAQPQTAATANVAVKHRMISDAGKENVAARATAQGEEQSLRAAASSPGPADKGG